MDELKIICPHCQQTLVCRKELSGKMITCPSCSSNFQAPKLIAQAVTSNSVLSNQSNNNERNVSPMGIASLVLGIIACITCWIPFLGLFSIPVSGLGLLFGLIGLLMSLIGKKHGLAFPISGSIICTIAISIALLSTGGYITLISNIFEEAKENYDVMPASKKLPTVVKLAQNKENVENFQKTQPFINASKPIRQGNTQIQIKNVRTAKIRYKNRNGLTSRTKNKFLIIKFEIVNFSKNENLIFKTWKTVDEFPVLHHATLIDNNDYCYIPVSFNDSSLEIGGVSERVIIGPGKSATEILAFNVPENPVNWLRLKLPASNLNGYGMLRFEIPGNMIK